MDTNFMWHLNGNVFTEDISKYYGFVYLITNISNDKKYIGKKTFWFRKTKISKGKRKKVLVESDWRVYTGSSNNLNSDIDIMGEDKFTREILKLCFTKSECTYYEAKYQFERDVLLYPDKFYNSWISCKIMGKNLKLKT